MNGDHSADTSAGLGGKRYWYAHDSLLETGMIVHAKGRGGAVHRAHPDQSAETGGSGEAELIGEAALAYLYEADLYPDIRATLIG